MDIIITMAGHSRRFKEQGYKEPKFLIPIANKPMISWVCNMFDTENDKYHFIINEDQAKEFPDILECLKDIVKSFDVKIIVMHEKGPVYSALQVDDIESFSSTIVTYCDFFVEWDYNKFKKDALDNDWDAAIPSFKGFHPASFGDTYYAYTRQDDNNNLIELREKQPFTNKRHEEYANSGVYYFKSGQLFKKYSDQLEQQGYGDFKEGYVSLLANLFVKDNLIVKITDIDKFICFGTPEDVEQFQSWYEFFTNKRDTEVYYCKGQEKQEYRYWKVFFEKWCANEYKSSCFSR